jgi:hypothetical protein
MEITKVKKRNGAVVDFDRHRIERAIEKACVATAVTVSSEFYYSVTDDVTGVIEHKFDERIPGVEDIQDIVEMMLAERGLFEVAKAYILYRKQRQDVRRTKQDELLEKIDRREIKVVKRSGEVVDSIGEIEKAITNCCQGSRARSTLIGVLPTPSSVSTTASRRRRSTRPSSWPSVPHRARPGVLHAGRAFPFQRSLQGRAGMDEFGQFPQARTRLCRQDQGGRGGRASRRAPVEFDVARLGSAPARRDRLFNYLGAQVLYTAFLEEPQAGDHGDAAIFLDAHRDGPRAQRNLAP